MSTNEHNYLNLLRDVMENGTYKPDRTGTGVKSVFGRQSRYDLRVGFPLLTTKKMNLASIVSELLWFVEGSGDERRLAEIRYGKSREQLTDKTTIWTANAEADYWTPKARFEGDLGRVYGQGWRKWLTPDGPVGLIKKKEKVVERGFVPSEHQQLGLKVELIPSDLDGQLFSSQSGNAMVIGKVCQNGSKNSKYMVEFASGTWLQVQRPNLATGEFKDPYALSVRNVACIGRVTPEMKKRSYYKRAYDMWNSMIARCYDSTHPSYGLYGRKGVVVSGEWKCFENFMNTLHNVPYFYQWLENKTYDLDKDYFGAEGYSADTCIFIEHKMNTSFGSPMRDRETGRLFVSQHQAADLFEIADSTLQHRIAEDGFYASDGYRVEPYCPPSGMLVRPQIVTDQLANLIHAIKTDPHGRRHILSAWNPGELDQMALPPCHVLCQFYVSNGELSCLLYQRSNDLFLGSPYNIASYALLTRMIAQVCGLEAGELVYSQGDTHIYVDHFDAVMEQLTRTPYPSPVLYINPSITEIGDFKMSDFELHHYESHPLIKAKMAV